MRTDKVDNIFGASSFTLIVSFVCLTLLGLALIPQLTVKLVPSQDMPGLSVSYSVRDASSRMVESEVTSKLEGALARVGGVKGISSSSNNGNGSIRLSFDRHTDLAAARFEVSTIIRQVWPELPDGVSYPQINMSRSESDAERPFLTYTLNAPATPALIQQYGEEMLEPALAQIDGVYRVELSGAMPMEWILTYDSDHLRQTGLTPDDIREAVLAYSRREHLGVARWRDSDGREERRAIVVRAEDPQRDFSFADIMVPTPDHRRLVPLDRLVSIEHREAEPSSYFRINGLNSVYLSVTATPEANQLEVGHEVREKLRELEARMPAGYELHKSYDATEYIQQELDKIYFRTALTLLILLLFVLVITRSWRYLLLIVISLTVTMLTAVIFYRIFRLEMQLYSLAGLTISLNLVMDNTIVMADHIRRRHNLKAFTATLAATLTTMGALVIIFFMDERVRLNLQDFAAVVIIDLAVSLLVALFLVPALMDTLRMSSVRPRRRLPRRRLRFRRLTVRFTHVYGWLIGRLCRWRAAVCVVLALAFGLPVFMLPEEVEGTGWAARIYNATLGSKTYKEQVKPYVDACLGGTLRLFADKVYTGQYFSQKHETVLSINANLPNGSTLAQMNHLIGRMEAYLSEFDEIAQFQTRVESANRASIEVRFTKAGERSGFPYLLKANVISKALELGGGSWGVYGLEDQGFSNDVRESAGSYRVKLTGYNYDELTSLAETLRDSLLTYRRIKEVDIRADFSYWKDDYTEFYLKVNKRRLAEEDITAAQLFAALAPVFGSERSCGTVWVDGQAEQLKLTSRQSATHDVWGLMNLPFEVNGRIYKVSELATITREQAPQKVRKQNQEYVLCLQFDYIGASQQGQKVLEQEVKKFAAVLPMGYKATIDNPYAGFFDDDDGIKREYLLLGLVIAIIFVTTSVLFNSLRQPLAIIFVIPISYIGVFLTFYLFELDFDQGGFAAFVLLCGITVNASIYILNEYNSLRRRLPCLRPLQAYLRAWNAKVVPIFLTVVSTILGFIPFMIGEEREAFWFPLAAGTIGGLAMSLVGIFFYLPVFSLRRRDLRVRR